MLKGENIICLSWLKWDWLPLVMHQMMTRLARDNRVLFVDPAVSAAMMLFHPERSREVVTKCRQWLQGVKVISDTLSVYYPPPLLVSFGHSPATDRLNQALLGGAIQRIAARLRFTNPILWIYDPYVLSPAGQFGEKIVCYDCNDDVGSFYPSRKRRNLRMLEDRLTKRADVVFATSRSLYAARKKWNPNTHYFPSGIDFDLFQRARDPGCVIPDGINRLGRPMIGYVGSIANYRIRWDWIRELADRHPDWSLVFIGPCVEKPPMDVSGRRNVHFLGPKSAEELPGYLKAFSVGIIPYGGEDFLQSCQPTKTFEYLAAGLPVVASDIPELRDYTDVVKLSRTGAEFVAKVEEALAEGGAPAYADRCTEAARPRTWDERLRGTSARIADTLRSMETGGGVPSGTG